MATRKTPQTFGSGGSYVNSTSGTSGVSYAVGDVLVLFPATSTPTATAIATITDSLGNTYTKKLGKSANTSVNSSLDCWVCVITTAGTPTWTVTGASGQYATMLCGVLAYTGMDTAPTLDGSVNFTVETSYISAHTAGSYTTLNANDVGFMGYVNSNATETFTTPTGYNTISSIASTGQYLSLAVTDIILSATGAQNPSMGTTGSDEGIAFTVFLKQAVVVVAPTTTPTAVNISKGDTELLIYWNDTSGSTATSYTVQRSLTLGGTYTTVGSPTNAYYKDTGLTNGTSYYYKVCGTNSAGNGSYSAAVTLAPAARPSTPADKWYKYGAAPNGVTQTNARSYSNTHYGYYKTYCFTQTGATQAGKGAWRVQVPDQTDPVSGTSNGTFSEGKGYGMIVTAYFSNWNNPNYDIYAQMYFDGFWLYYQNYMNAHGLMNWRISASGTVTGTGGATDGDEDVAVALVFMYRLYGSGGSVAYGTVATTLINNIRDYEFLPASDPTYPNLMMNGDAWGSSTDWIMPDYFAPAWYVIFQQHTGDTRWSDIITANLPRFMDYWYTTYNYGLVPDNSTRGGAAITSPTAQGYTYGYNAVRFPWRIACDWAWNGRIKSYNSLYRLGSDQKTRSSNSAAGTFANPKLDQTARDAYTNQVFVSGYGLSATSDAAIADFAASALTWLNTNAQNEASYFGSSLGAVALIFFSGEMLPFMTYAAVADTAAGSDSPYITQLKAFSDTGAGVDTSQLLGLISRTDNATGADVVALLALISKSDSGSAIDAITLIANIYSTDAATGSDVIALLGIISRSDSAVGVDTLNLLVLIASTDSAAAIDALLVINRVALSDSAAAVDAVAALGLVAQSDAGVGKERAQKDSENFEGVTVGSVPSDMTISSSVVQVNSVGGSNVLYATGGGDWWYFTGSRFQVNGDFEIDYDVQFSTGSRDIFNFAFWINNAGASANGFCFRLQTNADDGGWFVITTGSHSAISASVVGVTGGVWYRVTIKMVGTIATATVIDTRDGSTFVTSSQDVGSYLDSTHTTSGAFGQKQDGAGSYHYVDNIKFFTPSPQVTALVLVRDDKNLITNPSFEYGLNDISGGTVAIDTIGAADSGHSLKFTTTGYYDDFKNDNPSHKPVTGGAQYTASIYVTNPVAHTKNTGGSNQSNTILYVYWFDSTNTYISEQNFVGAGIDLATVHSTPTQMIGTLTAPSNAAYGEFHVYQYGVGSGYYDDWRVIKMVNVETVNMLGMIGIADGSPQLIANGDFETVPSPNTTATTGGNVIIDGTAGGGAYQNYTLRNLLRWQVNIYNTTAGSAQYDTTTSHSGSASMKLSGTNIQERVNITLGERNYGDLNDAGDIARNLPQLLPNTSYKVSFWSKVNITASTGSPFTANAMFDLLEHSDTGFVNHNNIYVSSSETTWTYHELIFTTQAATTHANVFCGAIGSPTDYWSGSIWFDDIKLVAQTGLGVEAVNLLSLIAQSDSGIGSEALNILGIIASSDSATAVDAVNILGLIARSDSGVGADAITLLGLIGTSDSATASDAVAVLGQIALSDAGSGVDIINAAANLTNIGVSDVGAAVDALNTLAMIASSDSAVASEAISLLVQIALSESGVGLDVVSILNQLSVTDAAVGTEIINLIYGHAVSDSAIGVDALNILTTILLNDTGIGADIISGLTNMFTINDAATGNDAINVFVAFKNILVGDAGDGTEFLNIINLVAQVDAAVATDMLTTLVMFTLNDSGSATEAINIVNQFYVIDAGIATDVISRLVTKRIFTREQIELVMKKIPTVVLESKRVEPTIIPSKNGAKVIQLGNKNL